MKRHDQVLMMQHVESLRDRLLTVPVHKLTDLRKGTRKDSGRGLPPYVLSHAVTFLAEHQDLDKFKRFLLQLPKMDVWTAQNVRYPQDYHLTLRTILLDWLRRNPDLTAEQCVYVLSWVRRQLPASGSERLQLPASEMSEPLPRPTRKDLVLLQDAGLAPPGKPRRFSSGAGTTRRGDKSRMAGLGALAEAFEKARRKK